MWRGHNSKATHFKQYFLNFFLLLFFWFYNRTKLFLCFAFFVKGIFASQVRYFYMRFFFFSSLTSSVFYFLLWLLLLCMCCCCFSVDAVSLSVSLFVCENTPKIIVHTRHQQECAQRQNNKIEKKENNTKKKDSREKSFKVANKIAVLLCGKLLF